MADGRQQVDEWLSANRAGKLIGITGKTIIRMSERGEITGYQVGSVWRFRRSDVTAYLEARRHGPDRRQDDEG
jgi:excisionase family DNA binding protein